MIPTPVYVTCSIPLMAGEKILDLEIGVRFPYGVPSASGVMVAHRAYNPGSNVAPD